LPASTRARASKSRRSRSAATVPLPLSRLRWQTARHEAIIICRQFVFERVPGPPANSSCLSRLHRLVLLRPAELFPSSRAGAPCSVAARYPAVPRVVRGGPVPPFGGLMGSSTGWWGVQLAFRLCLFFLCFFSFFPCHSVPHLVQ
jgi:hypothetical protein